MSNTPEKPQLNLEEVIEYITAELKNAGSTPFSDHAFEEFKGRIKGYAVDLIAESVKSAKRHQAEGVSSSDVRFASQYLYLLLVIEFTAMQALLLACCSGRRCRMSFQ